MEVLKPKPRIEELRKKAGLTQLQLAQKLGVTETTIANWERSRNGLEWIARIILLCEALHCHPKDLIELVPDGSNSSKPEDGSLYALRQLLGTERPAGTEDKPSDKSPPFTFTS